MIRNAKCICWWQIRITITTSEYSYCILVLELSWLIWISYFSFPIFHFSFLISRTGGIASRHFLLKFRLSRWWDEWLDLCVRKYWSEDPTDVSTTNQSINWTLYCCLLVLDKLIRPRHILRRTIEAWQVWSTWLPLEKRLLSIRYMTLRFQ